MSVSYQETEGSGVSKRMEQNMKLRILAVAFVVLLVAPTAGAQEFGIKTNLFSDAFMNVNLGIEGALAPKWTLDLEGQFNDWTLSHGRKWKHWGLQPEARYWFCYRFLGHFIGVHAHGGEFNMGGFDGIYHLFGTDARKLKDYRYQGWFVGAGVSYGYAWALAEHWNMEAELGVGYSYSRFDVFECAGCGRKIDEDKSHHYVGPTRLALNLVYLF